MIKLVLKAKKKINGILNLRNISMLNNINMNKKFIKDIPLTYKNKNIGLSEVFSINISKSKKKINEISIIGCNEFCNNLGYKWKNDLLKVNSNLGSHIGNEMTSGKIMIDGSVENYLGSGMKDGLIIVKGNANDFAGSASFHSRHGMSGGEIMIEGNLGNFSCNFMRKGLMIVKGNVGNYSCFNMVAGTLVVLKNIGENTGISMKRGTIISKLGVVLKNNFEKCGEFDLGFIKMLNSHLKINYSIKLAKHSEKFARYVGDKNLNGLGEIFIKK